MSHWKFSVSSVFLFLYFYAYIHLKKGQMIKYKNELISLIFELGYFLRFVFFFFLNLRIETQIKSNIIEIFMCPIFRLILLSTILSVIFSIACVNDSRCTNCQLEYLSTSAGLIGYYLCYKCIQNRTINQNTGQCQCIGGYYQSDDTSCQKCPQKCATCSSSADCNSCYAADYRNLISGDCVCIDGYEEKDNSTACKQKPNILMIILSTIGSGICMTFCFILCAFIRMRRCSQQIHAEAKNKKQAKNSIQIEEYSQYYGRNEQKKDSNYWNTKNEQFKDQQICSICLDPNPLFITQCSHYFHKKCIFGWLALNSTCPNCNKQIQPKEIKRWCQKCRKILMPVVMNIAIKKDQKTKKKFIHSTPIDNQLCNQCEQQCLDLWRVNSQKESDVKLKNDRISEKQSGGQQIQV